MGGSRSAMTRGCRSATFERARMAAIRRCSVFSSYACSAEVPAMSRWFVPRDRRPSHGAARRDASRAGP